MKTEMIINLIQQLYCNGISRAELAYKYGVSIETIRRYSIGKIPANKQTRFIDFVKTNYKEIYDYVLQEEQRLYGRQ